MNEKTLIFIFIGFVCLIVGLFLKSDYGIQQEIKNVKRFNIYKNLEIDIKKVKEQTNLVANLIIFFSLIMFFISFTV